MKFRNLLIAIAVAIPLLHACTGCDPDYPEQEIRNIIYNETLINKELQHLEQSNYPDKVKERQIVLIEADKSLKESLLDHIFVSIRQPPAPCPPDPWTDPHCFPGGLRLDDLFLGIMSNIPAESSMNIVDKSTGKTIAAGELVDFDKLHSTAWFKFSIKNSELLANEMLLKANTAINDGGSVSVVSIEDNIPANSFTGGK